MKIPTMKNLEIVSHTGNLTLLLLKRTNNRTLVCWYDEDKLRICMGIFHDTEQPNAFSKKKKVTPWGYPTLYIKNLFTTKDADEFADKFINYLEMKDYWWEKDN